MSTQITGISTDEYGALVARGFFSRLRGRFELIDGELRQMNPAGPVHDDLIAYLTRWSIRNIDQDQMQVRVQSGLCLTDLASQPEPDVVWVKARRYLSAHPRANDVLLLIEVANTSLDFDSTEKARLYSAAGISEYWIIDVLAKTVVVHRDCGRDGYQTIETHRPGDRVAPLIVASAILEIADLFGDSPS